MRFVIGVLALVMLGVVQAASASVLLVSREIPFEFSIDGLLYDGPPEGIVYRLCYMDGDAETGIMLPLNDTLVPNRLRLFEPSREDPYTYTRTAANDPNFNAFAAKLTDGQDAWLAGQPVAFFEGSMSNGQAAGPSTVFSESWLLSPREADFAGYELTSVTFTTDITGSTWNPFEPFVPYQVNGVVTVTFEGTLVPEPAGMAVMVGAALLLKRRRGEV